jgi:hypothetical protein
MIVLLYKCSLLGHTFFLFSPHYFLGLLFDICHFFDKAKDDDLLKLWMPFFNPYFDHCLPVCLQNEALLNAASFLTSGNGL